MVGQDCCLAYGFTPCFLPPPRAAFCAYGQLIVSGTIIGYDDFNHGLPTKGGDSWKAIVDRKLTLEGEPRAHLEVGRKHGVRFEQIASVPTTGGQSGWAFTVVVPDVDRGDHGHNTGSRHHHPDAIRK
jgi:hypothetical protein